MPDYTSPFVQGFGQGQSIWSNMQQMKAAKQAREQAKLDFESKQPNVDASQFYSNAPQGMQMNREEAIRALASSNDWRKQLALKKAEAGIPTKLNADEAKTLGQATASARGLADVGKTFQETGMKEVNPAQRFIKGLPLVGQGGMLSGPLDAMMPETTKYLNQQRQQVESDLRAATGATAPEAEVKTYLSFMPQPGDSEDLAAKKLQDYYNKISNKVEGVAAAHEASGDYMGAQKIRENMKNIIAQSGLQSTIQGMSKPQGGNQKMSLAQQILNDPEAGPDDIAWAQAQMGQR